MDQKEVVLYTTRHRSWYTWRARRLLRHKGYAFEVVDTTNDVEFRAWLAHSSGRNTAPYFFVDGRLVGGFNDVQRLDRSGDFDRLVRGEV